MKDFILGMITYLITGIVFLYLGYLLSIIKNINKMTLYLIKIAQKYVSADGIVKNHFVCRTLSKIFVKMSDDDIQDIVKEVYTKYKYMINEIKYIGAKSYNNFYDISEILK